MIESFRRRLPEVFIRQPVELIRRIECVALFVDKHKTLKTDALHDPAAAGTAWRIGALDYTILYARMIHHCATDIAMFSQRIKNGIHLCMHCMAELDTTIVMDIFPEARVAFNIRHRGVPALAKDGTALDYDCAVLRFLAFRIPCDLRGVITGTPRNIFLDTRQIPQCPTPLFFLLVELV
jgi:hypothetical protein